ncbi:MAG: MBL fold metallo-hydrolase [Bacilli bacterium]|nr:MBL fold metallo-hydrolase [Bacilli bacterium]
MYFHNIASGSKGNATIVVSNKTVILIDMGISFVSLQEGMKEINISPSEIDAAIFTHDHSDHYRGLKFLKTKKCYALEGTLPSLCKVVELYKPFTIKDITVTPLKTSHDATNPCGYMLEDGKEKLVYITDTGMFVDENLKYCKNPDYLVIESNHDISMELKTNRPQVLKERVLSDHGHLCNEDSAYASLDIMGPNTKEIYLAHLSEEANTPETALKAYREIFLDHNVDLDKIKIICLQQNVSTTGGHYEN